MGRIKNKELYPQDLSVSRDDYVIGTDNITGKTKTYTIGSILDLVIGGGGVDTFATLNGNILTLADGQTYDLTPVVDTDTDTFATLNSGIITFPDGSTVNLGTIDTDTFATINGNIITFSDGSTRDITPVVDTDTDTFATLNGTIITFADNSTINVPVNSEQNVQSDWKESNILSDSFILNKPISQPKSYIENLETDLLNIELKRVEENNKITGTDEIDLSSLLTINKSTIIDSINEVNNKTDYNENLINSVSSGIQYPIPQTGNTPSNEPLPISDGIYPAVQEGTYDNFGGIIVDLNNKKAEIIVSNNQTVFTLNESVIGIGLDSTPVNGSVNAIESGGVYPISSFISSFIINKGDFPLYDYDSYNVVYGTSTFSNNTDGLNITTTGDSQINIGKTFDNSVSKITLTGVCKVNNTAYFGIGLKNGVDWGGMMYRGSTGARSMLDYASPLFMTGAGIISSTPYNINDKVTVEIQFIEGLSYVRTAVNDVFTPLTRMSEQYNNVDNGGELHICLRSATEWENITLNVQKNNNQTTYYLSPTGNDNNSGTYLSPLATLEEANSRILGNGEIILKKGDYWGLNYVFKKGVKIKGENKDLTRIINGQKIDNAVLVSGKVYRSLSPYVQNNGENYLFQYGVPEDDTLILDNERLSVHNALDYRCPITRKITKVNSIAEIESSTELAYYYDGTNLYFSKATGSDLSINPIFVPKFTKKILTSDTYISNLTILGEGFTVSDSNLYLTDVNIGAINNTNINATGNENIYGRILLNRVNSFHSTNDGFAGNGYGKIIEKECWSHDNLDEGSSMHEVSVANRINSIYEYNNSAGCVDVGSTSIYMNGCYFQGNSNGSVIFSNQIIYGKDYQNARVINCVLQENVVPSNFGNIKFIGCSTLG